MGCLYGFVVIAGLILFAFLNLGDSLSVCIFFALALVILVIIFRIRKTVKEDKERTDSIIEKEKTSKNSAANDVAKGVLIFVWVIAIILIIGCVIVSLEPKREYHKPEKTQVVSTSRVNNYSKKSELTDNCRVAGCDENVCDVRSYYCSRHMCHENNCYTIVFDDTEYCLIHQPKEKVYLTFQNTGKKKSDVEMPDCDLYEDNDDFLDEWQDMMPDGSDAQEYWDNW